MAGYAKFWTFMLSDEWFLSLNNVHRGIFMQLVLICKDQGDDGYVSFTSRTLAADYMQTPRQTLAYFTSISEPQVCVHCLKPFKLYLPQYIHWQELTLKDATSEKRRKNDTRPYQTIPYQSIARAKKNALDAPENEKKKRKKKTDTKPPIERFESYLQTDFVKIIGIGRIYKKDCSDQYLINWLKRETEKMKAWIVANPDKVKNRSRWGQFINNWVRKARDQSDSTGGMTHKQEQEHYANKRRSGESSGFKRLMEVE